MPSPTVVPPFVALAGHPLRWRLLAELADSDRQVSELTAAVGRPQALVSYHLGQLRAGGLVSAKRSSFDGRVAYYRVHLTRCGELLVATGDALQPGLVGPAAVGPPGPGRVQRVLFACTGNGSRSQIAEALLRQCAGGALEVVSGGSHPKPIHPNALAVLRERGIDGAGLRSKSLDEFAGRSFDQVVTLCDKVREVCPEFPGGGRRRHWSIEDPASVPGSARRTLPVFRALAADLSVRVAFLHQRIADEHNKERHRHGR